MLSMTKDSEVEVSSEDEGFTGAWYRAILQENPTKSGRKKLQVRYMTLVDEDGSSLLTELVEQRLIRPVPPEDPNPNGGVDFEEGSVVDADLKDGWWTGVVVKKTADHDKFLVYFDHPPDVMQFEKKQLRTHLDLIGSEWVRPENKELSKSLFRSGTMVEVSCKIDKLEAVWVPALIVKEDDDEQKRLVVKCCDNKSFTLDGGDDAKPNIIAVDLCDVRPKPPPCFVDKYDLLDRVDAFRGLGWRQGLVRRILSEERYIVSFVATKEESVFIHSDLRPSKEWEDGVWLQQPKSQTKPGNKTPPQGKRKMSTETTLMCRPKKLKIICSSTVAKPITYKRTRKRTKTSPNSAEHMEIDNERETVATIELSLARISLNQMADDARNGDATPVIMIPIAKESVPPVTPVIFATPVKETQGETSPLRNQNGLGVDSNGAKMSEEHNSNDNSHSLIETGEACNGSKALITDYICDDDDDYDDQPLSSWILGAKSSTASHKSNTTTVLPFVKHSPVWEVFESMEVFKSVKQSPHFSPLLESREEFREGLAVCEMVKYCGLLERVENLQLHTPKSTLERLKDCFAELDKYGFDVLTPISRIEMLLSLKDKQVKRLEELNDEEKKMTEEVIKKEKVEEDLRDVERKILELRSQETELKEKKNASEKEIAEMQLCVSTLDKKIQDVEVEFQMIVSAPW